MERGVLRAAGRVQQVVLTMEATNPSADPLRSVLARYGAQVAQTAEAGPVGPGPVSAPPPPRSSVQQQQLAPVQQQPARRY